MMERKWLRLAAGLAVVAVLIAAAVRFWPRPREIAAINAVAAFERHDADALCGMADAQELVRTGITPRNLRAFLGKTCWPPATDMGRLDYTFDSATGDREHPFGLGGIPEDLEVGRYVILSAGRPPDRSRSPLSIYVTRPKGSGRWRVALSLMLIESWGWSGAHGRTSNPFVAVSEAAMPLGIVGYRSLGGQFTDYRTPAWRKYCAEQP